MEKLFGYNLFIALGCQKNPTEPESKLTLGTVKGKVSGAYSTNFEYSGCKLIMEAGNDGEIFGERSQDGMVIYLDKEADPDNFSNFPKSLEIRCYGPVTPIFVRYRDETLSFIRPYGSFMITGRRDDHSFYGTFSFEAVYDEDTTQKIIVTEGEFNVSRVY